MARQRAARRRRFVSLFICYDGTEDNNARKGDSLVPLPFLYFTSPMPPDARRIFPIKEVFQPHLPVRLPCYDLAPVTGFTLGRSSQAARFRSPRLPWLDGRCVQGPGTYSPRRG